ncbi:hypothetical protein VKT23_009999 [Stygiomarasmius scandens]|uniref:DUF6534 domain-containing protein n=1 Tax=Marasmiellus scandens TaxID=2682957 RepID=A0ABR1JCR5_9AGAR
MAQVGGPPVSALPLGVDLSGSYDGFFYGFVIGTGLFGVVVVQAWIYFNSHEDRWPLRTFVALIVLLDFALTCINTQITHHYFISSFGNLIAITKINKSLVVDEFLTIIVVFCVEVFFASHIWRMHRFHWLIPVIIVSCATGAVVAGISSVVEMAHHNELSSLGRRTMQLKIGFDCALTSVSDVFATVALSWSFFDSKTGFKRTDTLLQKLLRYTITRGLFVTSAQVGFLILFLSKPQKLWWMPFYISLSKVYVITMIVMLNSREGLRNHVALSINDSEMQSGQSPISRRGFQLPRAPSNHIVPYPYIIDRNISEAPKPLKINSVTKVQEKEALRQHFARNDANVDKKGVQIDLQPVRGPPQY